MTEEQWLACEDPGRMLRFRPPDEAAKKTRIFKCICCRHIWHLLTDHRSRQAVEITERYVGGEATIDKLSEAANGAAEATRSITPSYNLDGTDSNSSRRTAAQAAEYTAANSRFVALGIAQWIASARGTEHSLIAPYDKNVFKTAHQQASKFICEAVRDIFGNPFCPVTLDPSWLTSNVIALAQQMYDSRDFTAMPILADTLQDAGCADQAVLEHCRGAGTHVRGCWVVDLATGRG